MIRIIVATFTTIFAFVAFAAVASAAESQGERIKCFEYSHGVSWVNEGNGQCPGYVLVEDVIKAKAKNATRIPFGIGKNICPSGWAWMIIEIRGDNLTAYPWRKSCAKKPLN